MKKLFLVIMVVCCLTGCSENSPKEIFDKYMWEKNVLLIFIPSEDDIDYRKQKLLNATKKKFLANNDVVLWEIFQGGIVVINDEKKPHLPSNPFYEEFNVKKDKFELILIGKDGLEKVRSQVPRRVKAMIGMLYE